MMNSEIEYQNYEVLPFYDKAQKAKNTVGQFESKELDKNEMQILKMTEEDYPVIPVQNRYYLIAISSKNFTGIRWLANWFEIDSIYRDQENTHHVKLKAADKIVEVDYGMLYPKDITGLAKYGIIIDFEYVQEMSRYVLKKAQKYEIEQHSNHIGFAVRKDGFSFEAYDLKPQVLQYTHEIVWDDYVKGMNALLTNASIMFALCCSCASLFLAYLGMKCEIPLQSFIISFYGKSTTGKSTAQTMMASVYTKPDDNKVYIPFFGTIHAIVKNIANKFGVPQIFDEATVSSNINMESLLYTITLEHDKGRCNSNATLKNSDTWKTIVITSSENPLLSETRMHNKWLDARLLSFSLKFTNDRVHSDQIHEFCGKNYGILGKALSEYLLGVDSENIVKIYEDCNDQMRNAIEDTTYFDLTERLVNAYGLILMAAKVLSDFGFSIDRTKIRYILIENHREIAERSNIAERFYHHIMAYVAMNPFSTSIKMDESKNVVAILEETFNKILIDHGATNTRLVIKELGNARYLHRSKDHTLKCRRQFNKTLTNCYDVYMPTEEAESQTPLESVLTNFEGMDET